MPEISQILNPLLFFRNNTSSNIAGKYHYDYESTMPESNKNWDDYRFGFNGKENDNEVKGLGNQQDYGMRIYDPRLGRFLSVDPMADKYPSMSAYMYVLGNPLVLIDPNGMSATNPSTHTDDEGNVIAVYKDGDNGVYKHGSGTTKADVDAAHSAENTSAGGEKMGETAFWDEFRAHDDETGAILGDVMEGARIMFNESWEPTIEKYNNKALEMESHEIAFQSTSGGDFDIKNDPSVSPHGHGTGKLMGGYYFSARSAGNFLAGYNGYYAAIFGVSLTFDQFMGLAGAVHQNKFSITTAPLIIFGGKRYGPAPYYGEVEYCGRMSRLGWAYGEITKPRPIINWKSAF